MNINDRVLVNKQHLGRSPGKIISLGRKTGFFKVRFYDGQVREKQIAANDIEIVNFEDVYMPRAVELIEFALEKKPVKR